MFSRPSLSALVTRIRNDVLSRQKNQDALRRNDADVQAVVMAGIAHGLYGFIDWVSKQILPDTSDADILARQAAMWGVPQKLQSEATGTIVFTQQAGAIIPAGTLVQALDGVQYQTTADAPATTPTTTVGIVAVNAGAAGNRAAGQNMTFVTPVPGVQSTGVASALSGGADTEAIEAWRARVIYRIQNPPQGGSAYDYVSWALEVPGVTRAWCYPQEMGAGSVTVRFMRDNESPAIPDAGEVATVQAYIDTKRHVTGKLYVVAPIAAPLNFTIQGLVPSTSAVQAAVHAELRDLLVREAASGGTILLSHIHAAISAAAGETDYVLVSPTENVVNATGYISTMGSITWL